MNCSKSRIKINTVKNKMFFVINSCYLVSLSIIFRMRAGSALLGKEFDCYGRKLSLLFLFSGSLIRFRNWMCNPVSIVRYFEFPFVIKAIDWKAAKACLDISSPRLFPIYLAKKFPHLKLEISNPDNNDLNETATQLRTLGSSCKINYVSYDATSLPYLDNSFDVITSISVIEHIPDRGDSLAIKEMWRVLKPGGKLVFTVPCAKLYYEEWRENDVYQLGNTKKDNKYFFQRFYDKSTLKNRLFHEIGFEPTLIEVFGEKVKGTFDCYIKRWIKFGLKETIKDPYYIVRDYKHFDDINMLPGIGICGLIFEKSK